MFRVARLLTTLLAFTPLAANSASAITAVSAEKPASGLFRALEQRVGIDALANSGRIDEKLSLLYDFASDFPVAARTVTVTHFTSAEGVAAIEGSGALRAGSFVARPGEISGLTASEVEGALEIQAGRGAFSYTFQTPATNLATPFNGPFTSGIRTQYVLRDPVPVAPGSFVPTP